MIEWLSGRYGFSGDAQQAQGFRRPWRSSSGSSPARCTRRLKAGGREYNEVGGVRARASCAGATRSRAVPRARSGGQSISYEGDIIQIRRCRRAPPTSVATSGCSPRVGQQVFGIEGEAPPSTAGVVTPGVGNIRSYALAASCSARAG